MAPNSNNTCSIIRKSVFKLLQNHQYFTSTSTLLAFPYAASYLLTQSLVTSSHLYLLVQGCLRSLFLAAGFPSSLQFFAILNLKLSQTVTTFLFVSPFAFTFLLLAKASVIIHHRKSTCSDQASFLFLFSPLLITQLCNLLVILAANAACFFYCALCFNFLGALGLSSSQGLSMFLSTVCVVIYYIVVANANAVCNLASVSSGMENCGGLISILDAWFMIQGRTRTATALSLVVAMKMGLAAIESLFQYRVARAYPNSGLPITEGVLIAFLYALVLVLDSVVGCVFWRRCKKDDQIDQQQEIIYVHDIEIADNSRP